MRKFHVSMCILLVLCMALLSTTAFAAGRNLEPSIESLQQLPYEEKLERLEWHDISELDSIKKEDTYTYDEYILYLKSNGFTDEEALEFAGERPMETRSSTVRYSPFSMKVFTYRDQDPLEDGYYKIQAKISVGMEYLGNSSSPHRIVALMSPSVYTSVRGGDKCAFDGNIEYTLTAGNEFYYCFSGSLYKRGNTQWKLGGKIGIGESFTLEASFSGDDGFITDVYEGETYHSDALAA